MKPEFESPKDNRSNDDLPSLDEFRLWLKADPAHYEGFLQIVKRVLEGGYGALPAEFLDEARVLLEQEKLSRASKEKLVHAAGLRGKPGGGNPSSPRLHRHKDGSGSISDLSWLQLKNKILALTKARQSERIGIGMTLKNNLAVWRAPVRLCLIGGLLAAFVFLMPDAGQQQHKSFFAIACTSAWGRYAEWSAAWCSIKIILCGISAVLLVDALGNLAIRRKNEILGLAFVCMAVLPAFLAMFGVYQLAKAVF